jgi:hypothetical protein
MSDKTPIRTKEGTHIMLYKAKTLTGYKLETLSGEIGKVKDFYFSDQDWMIRYLVADTGNWLTGRGNRRNARHRRQADQETD